MLIDKCPLVSVVIPSYNGMPYLKEAIESVLAQDYPNVELIVLDDGSTDETASFLKTYSGRLHYETQARLGQAMTLNKGWQMCQGVIIGYLSADDKLKSNAISLSVHAFMEDEDIILTYADNLLIDDKSQPIRKYIPLEMTLHDMLRTLFTPIAVASFFRKSTFEGIGGWNSSYRQLGDFEYHLRLITQGKFKKIPNLLGFHRVHEGSASFSAMAVDRADEYLLLVNTFFQQEQTPEILSMKDEIQAQAFLLSGRNHWRSGRYLKGLIYFFTSLKSHPKLFLKTKSYHIVINALLNKPLHRCLKTYRMMFARSKTS
ncbi:MAG: glycosyltransferase [Legionellales bacterium]|nr:glycosyltransferase [Legionellales bacterium]